MTDLPPFSTNPTCPKCGGTRVRVFWQAAFTDPIGGRDLPECVVRTCKHCHYDWRELPLDATDADDEPEDAYLAGKLAGCEEAERAASPSDLNDLANYLLARWDERINGGSAVDVAIRLLERFRTGHLTGQEPSIPVSRIVAVLAERYMGMYEVKQRRTGIDRVSYHSRSLEDAWVSAALSIDHEFDAAVAELARRKGTA